MAINKIFTMAVMGLIFSSCMANSGGRLSSGANTNLIGTGALSYSTECPEADTLATGCTCSDNTGVAIYSCPSCDTMEYDQNNCTCVEGVITCGTLDIDNSLNVGDLARSCGQKAYHTSTGVCEDTTLINLNDSRVLKIWGTAGSGSSFLAVDDLGPVNGFETVSDQYDYYIGSGFFSSVVNVIENVGGETGYTLIGFADGRILKIKGTGGSGGNFAAINDLGSINGFSSASGYDYYVGWSKFSSSVKAIENIGGETGYTLIGFADGRVLKIKGTGGSGANFAAINDNGSANGFSTVSGFNYYVGWFRFSSPVNAINNSGGESGYTLIGFYDGRVLKIRGTGGSGANFAAINDLGSTNGFSSVGGFNYYSGWFKFLNMVKYIKNFGGESGYTLIGFNDGRILKIRGTGGSGANFAAINDNGSNNGFSSVSGFNYYIGWDKINLTNSQM